VVREDFAGLRFHHTAIARIIELTAHASRLPQIAARPGRAAGAAGRAAWPRIWPRSYGSAWATRTPWPTSPPGRRPGPSHGRYRDTAVQVNGKVRFTIEVPASATRDDIAGLWPATPPRTRATQ